MDFELTEEQRLIQSHISDLLEEFDDEYWREKDQNHEFAWEFFETFGDHGWCGITIPEEYGGQGLGTLEATLVQQEIASSGAGMAGVSITGHHFHSSSPLLHYGDEEHKQEYLPKIADGDVVMCTAVTEPNAGIDTSRITTRAERDGDRYLVNGEKMWTSKAQVADVIMLLTRTGERDEDDRFGGMTLFFTDFDKDMDGVDVQEISKAGRGAVDSNQVWFEDFEIPAEHRIGEEGEGFKYLLSFANSGRIMIAANAVGLGQRAIEKGAQYANERVVFDNKIGSYQAIQHPLAESWANLQADETLVRKAAWMYDNDKSPGVEATAAKLNATEDSIEACERAMRVHGGVGYATEFDVERYWRESAINLFAELPNEMAKNFLAQKALGLPRSY